MRKLITTTFVTLDGVMQAPGGSDEDTASGFRYGGWSFPYWSQEVGEFMEEIMSRPFDMVLGRKTYDIFASFWPNETENPAAKPLNDATKYVASRGKPSLDWKESRLIEGDVVDGLRAIKETDGPELQVHGSGDLIQTLLDSDVIDEMRVLTYPVMVGNGKRLFENGTYARSLEPVKTSVASNGVVMSVYRPSGEVRTGSFS